MQSAMLVHQNNPHGTGCKCFLLFQEINVNPDLLIECHQLKLWDINVVFHQDALQRPIQFVRFVLPIIHVIYPWEPPVNMHVLRNGLFKILDDARKDICTPNFSKYGKEYYENWSLKRTNEVLQTFSTSRKSRVPSWSGSNISAIFWHFDSLGAFCTLRKADIISCKLILPSLRQKIGKCWIIQQHYCVT